MEMHESFVGRDATCGSGAGDGDTGSGQRAQEMKSRGGNLQIESAAYAEGVGVDSRNQRAYLDALSLESKKGHSAEMSEWAECRRAKKAWVKKHIGERKEVEQRRRRCPVCDWEIRYNELVCGKCGESLEGSIRFKKWVGGDGYVD
jgi:hypothetical protein